MSLPLSLILNNDDVSPRLSRSELSVIKPNPDQITTNEERLSEQNTTTTHISQNKRTLRPPKHASQLKNQSPDGEICPPSNSQAVVPTLSLRETIALRNSHYEQLRNQPSGACCTITPLKSSRPKSFRKPTQQWQQAQPGRDRSRSSSNSVSNRLAPSIENGEGQGQAIMSSSLSDLTSTSSPSVIGGDVSVDDMDIDTPPEHELNFREFSVFNALLNYPEVIHEIGKNLDPEDMFSLYCTSKDFHRMVDSRFVTTILGQSLAKAEESTHIFLFQCYRELCIADPAENKNEMVEGQLRDVPSFRWLRMVMGRERIVDDILKIMAVEGHHLPVAASRAIKKMWFMMDIPDNAKRIGLIHNRGFWSDADLLFATMFLIKLDMLLADPVNGDGDTTMRELLMAQRSLATMWNVLRRKEMLNQYDMLRMRIEWNWQLLPEEGQTTLFGIAARDIGTLQYEGWGKNTTKLLRPDQLVMRESVRRKLDFPKRYLDMILWGYVDSNTFEDVPALKLAELNLEEEEEEDWESIESDEEVIERKQHLKGMIGL